MNNKSENNGEFNTDSLNYKSYNLKFVLYCYNIGFNFNTHIRRINLFGIVINDIISKLPETKRKHYLWKFLNKFIEI